MNTLSHPALCSRMPAYLGQVIHRRHVKGDLAFDFSGIILRLEERVELAILRAAVAAVLRKYETLRLAFRRCPETGWFPMSMTEWSGSRSTISATRSTCPAFQRKRDRNGSRCWRRASRRTSIPSQRGRC
ncbi:hypothetical protein D3093_34200 (plasmid) [Azospirillum argentinense]|uniref:Condensation domain-containing protein n=1 Tax=Azospirillum argentinense TaxID=2970906 RepID=A0A4D8PSH2_9PROT|nr:hypothetical protein [Azospirillum argentinense]QCO00285.1 hypothetical protein D3093_34200 [Azospirillum argentinense]